MLFSNSTFIGIDPTAGRSPFVFVAIDNKLELLALGQGEIDEVLAYAAGQRQAVVAVNAPRQPNCGVMAREEVRENLSPPPRPGRWQNFRLAEYQIRQHNIHIPQTAARLEDCPNWMQMGFILFRRLRELGYNSYPDQGSSHQSLEVYPHACFAVLLGRNPLPKHSLEGRLQRQLILYDRKVKVPDPMRFFEEITRFRLLNGILPEEGLYSAEELDALVAAYTAWQAALNPEQVTLLGDPQEGQIVLPAEKLKSHY
jgi:predicted nuclease with RNAse H fold